MQSFLARNRAYLQVSPLVLVLLVFLIGPMIVILVFSFFKFSGFFWAPDFVFDNYVKVFTRTVTLLNYLKTLEMILITWAITLVLGFTLAYFFVFDLVSFRVKILFFLLAVVPFWTSGVVRMVSWLPMLGREGAINRAFMGIGLIDKPLDFLLFSEFSVIVSYVHVFTLFMVAPLFNVMARINPDLFEAARDQGASDWQILWNITIPMSKAGIVIGTIFVVALVASDFTAARVLAGGQMGTASLTILNQYGHFNYPFASASGIILLISLLLFVGGLMRLVDIRKQL